MNEDCQKQRSFKSLSSGPLKRRPLIGLQSVPGSGGQSSSALSERPAS